MGSLLVDGALSSGLVGCGVLCVNATAVPSVAGSASRDDRTSRVSDWDCGVGSGELFAGSSEAAIATEGFHADSGGQQAGEGSISAAESHCAKHSMFCASSDGRAVTWN